MIFRIWIIFQSKTGLLRLRFPGKYSNKEYIDLEDFRKLDTFFWNKPSELSSEKNRDASLHKKFREIKDGIYTLFSNQKYELGVDYDWITNPENSYQYNIHLHFSQVSDFSRTAGDIKNVWEVSRFCWIHDIIRYDYHYEEHNANLVISRILDWIQKNPLNYGPNYKCSQEISIRLLNWTFALFYYRNSPDLTQDALNRIFSSMASQINHVIKYINFSRIAVRNNHAITETFAIYAIHCYYPFLQKSEKWIKRGMKMFASEVNFQINEEGAYMQHSMNYHRLVVQILTLAVRTSEIRSDNLRDLIGIKSLKTLHFLSCFINSRNGFTPNYGANDGSLLFPLNNNNYRDYRAQINALSYALTKEIIFNDPMSFEDIYWLYSKPEIRKNTYSRVLPETISFKASGYFIFHDQDFFCFIKCASITGRTGINDNHHIDLWYKDQNILRDAGTYRYNTEEKLRKFFMGTKSHNTVMINNFDQIEKGPRFLSFGSSKVIEVTSEASENEYVFKGKIIAFESLGKGITHTRVVKYVFNTNTWTVVDSINSSGTLQQIWNYDNSKSTHFTIKSKSEENELNPKFENAYYSNTYGNIAKQGQLIIETSEKQIETEIHFLK